MRVNKGGKAADFKHVVSVDQPSLLQGFAENKSSASFLWDGLSH